MNFSFLFLMIYIFCMVSMLGFFSSFFMLLISLEFLVICIMMMLMDYFVSESFLELAIFMVLAVGESILGLILMLLKVVISGEDMVEVGGAF